MSDIKIQSLTFSDELAQAGLAGAPLSWTDQGEYDISQCTPEQQQIFLDTLAAHDPTTPPPPPPPDPQTVLLYDHENRVRLLEGQPPLSLQDFFTKMRT